MQGIIADLGITEEQVMNENLQHGSIQFDAISSYGHLSGW